MKYSLIILMLFLNSSCLENKKTTETKELLLLADREAPLGWIYLRIYSDSTFEFESRGVERTGAIYSGKMYLKGDTIIFHYSDSIPKAGNKALLTGTRVSYFAGKYPESVEIKLNTINPN